MANVDVSNANASLTSGRESGSIPSRKVRPNVLLIEDDPELASVVAKELTRRDYAVSHAQGGREGLGKVNQGGFDILVIDRMLPEIDGISIIQALRAKSYAVPVLIISALDDVDERVFGLQAGADDYLIKPFSFSELGARIEALLRRPMHGCATKLQVGPLSLNLLDRVAILRDEKIELSSREFQLLEYFMSRPGQLITRQMLLQNVWKFKFIPQTNVVDVHISKLRQKLENKEGFSFIKNVRGQGYVFEFGL